MTIRELVSLVDEAELSGLIELWEDETGKPRHQMMRAISRLEEGPRRNEVRQWILRQPYGETILDLA